MYTCFAFDLDGTLVDSVKLKHQAFLRVASQFNITSEQMDKILTDLEGHDRFDVLKELAWKVAGSLTGDSPYKKMLATFTAESTELVSTCPSIKGAEDLLKNLKESNIRTFINSRSPDIVLADIIENRGWEKYFDGVFGGQKSKTDNLREIQALTRIHSQNILMVGDQNEDLTAAQTFGCDFALIENENNSLLGYSSTHVTKDLTDLIKLI